MFLPLFPGGPRWPVLLSLCPSAASLEHPVLFLPSTYQNCDCFSLGLYIQGHEDGHQVGAVHHGFPAQKPEFSPEETLSTHLLNE